MTRLTRMATHGQAPRPDPVSSLGAGRVNHHPPGNAAPRFVDLRDGGNLTQEAQRPSFWAALTVIAFAVGLLGIWVETKAMHDLTTISIHEIPY